MAARFNRLAGLANVPPDRFGKKGISAGLVSALWRSYRLQPGLGCGAKHTAAILLIMSAVAPNAPTFGHDWYPKDCCHDMDCAPVESATWLTPASGGAPQLVVISKHGRAIIRQGISIRTSKDSRMHVCMKRYDPLGEMVANCLFLPADVRRPLNAPITSS